MGSMGPVVCMAVVSAALLPVVCLGALSDAVEQEISALEPELTSLLELSTRGDEKGAAYNRTADFCDLWVRHLRSLHL